MEPWPRSEYTSPETGRTSWYFLQIWAEITQGIGSRIRMSLWWAPWQGRGSQATFVVPVASRPRRPPLPLPAPLPRRDLALANGMANPNPPQLRPRPEADEDEDADDVVTVVPSVRRRLNNGQGHSFLCT